MPLQATGKNLPMVSRHGARWTVEEERELYQETLRGLLIAEIAEIHDRAVGGIRARQKRLGLRDDEGELVQPPPDFRPFSELLDQRKGRRPSMVPRRRSEDDSEPRRKSLSPDLAEPELSDLPKRQDRGLTIPAADDSLGWGALFTSILRRWIEARTFIPNNGTLDERSRQVLVQRFGLSDASKGVVTFDDLGRVYGVSKERIRQIERKGLRKLRSDIDRKAVDLGYALDRLIGRLGFQDDANLSEVAAFLHGIDGPPSLRSFLTAIAARRLTGCSWPKATKLAKSAVTRLDRIDAADRRSNRPQRRQAARDEAVEKADRSVLELLGSAVWPLERPAAASFDFSKMKSVRDVNGGRSHFSEKLGRAVQFESGGERRVLQAFDRCSFVDRYLEQPLEIPYTLDGEERIYRPDFLLSFDGGHLFVLEVKARPLLASYMTLVKALAAISHLRPLGLGYCLVDASGAGLRDIAATEVSEEIEDVVMSALAAGASLSSGWLRERLGRWLTPDDYDALQALAIRQRFRYDAWLSPSEETPRRFSLEVRLRDGGRHAALWHALRNELL